MPLLINNDVQERVIDMSDAIRVIEDAFTQLGNGDAAFYPRTDVMSFPTVDEEGELAKFWFACLQGAIRDPPRFALRYRSDVHWIESDGRGRSTTHKYNTTPGKYMGFVHLFDSSSGEMIAMLNDGIIQHVRVGATAGVAADQLAREDSRAVGMIGSGGMARTYAEAFSLVRDIEEIRVYSRTEEHRTAYAEAVSDELGIDVRPCNSVAEAISGADIVASCTNSTAPVFEAELLEPGQLYVNVNSREFSHDIADHVDKIAGTTRWPYIIDQRTTIGTDEQYDDFVGFWIPDHDLSSYSDTEYPELGEILVGDRRGRESDDEIVFYDNRSCGIQFAAVGDLIYRKAMERGLGTEVPTGWFLQDIVD